MKLSADPRSSTALVLLCMFLGTAAFPLLCVCEELRGCDHAAEETHPTHTCGDAPMPASSLSCCCTRESAPVSATPTFIDTDQTLAPVASIAAPVIRLTGEWSHGLDSAPLLIRTTPLFTLHSAFLI